MATAVRTARKLYTTRDETSPRMWIGEDPEGELWIWPDEVKGWTKRAKYDGALGSRRDLKKADPAEARGTGWHGGVGGGRRRLGGAEKGVARVIRAAPDLWTKAIESAAAEKVNLNEYVRRAIADRVAH